LNTILAQLEALLGLEEEMAGPGPCAENKGAGPAGGEFVRRRKRASEGIAMASGSEESRAYPANPLRMFPGFVNLFL
jgi:hypothetical protein